jgi:penicillin-binding protein 1A
MEARSRPPSRSGSKSGRRIWRPSNVQRAAAAAIALIGLAVTMVAWRVLAPAPLFLRLVGAVLCLGFWEGIAALVATRRLDRPFLIRALKIAGIGTLALTALMALLIAITFWAYSRDLPSVSQLKSWRPKQVTRIVVATRDGDEVIGEIYGGDTRRPERRSFVEYEDIPQLVVDAFVVAEDAGFWDHGGLDYRGMVRAFFVNLVSGDAKQGGSTITQQVVKNLVLSKEKTFRRKMQEIILARRLENELGKEQILELYLNQIYFGQGRYGVLEAARYYWGVQSLDELEPGEIAYLAGLPQAPEAISENPKWGEARIEYVINQLLEHGKITEEVARDQVNTRAPELKPQPPPIAPEVVDLVRAELRAEYGDQELETLGADVRVTIKPEIQLAARTALQARLRKYDATHKVGAAFRKVAPEKIDAEIAKLGKKLPESGPETGEIYPAVVTGVYDADGELEIDLGGWVAAVQLDAEERERFNPDKKPPSKRFARGDVVEVVVPGSKPPHPPKHGGGNVARLAPGPEGAVVVIDVKTRKVLALVGGYTARPGSFNRAVQAKRQPGSTFKPFVYAAALASGEYTAASIVNDAPDVYDLWKPKNYGKCCEGPIRIRHALAKSTNTVAVRVTHQLGPDVVAAQAQAMGIESDLPEHLSLSLGSGEVTPLELTNAFATFAAGGEHQSPRMVDAIDGQLRDSGPTTQALSPQISYVVLDMMRSVLESGGTGAWARQKDKKSGKVPLTIPAAGKTGTSNDERDAWFVGVTPDYAIGVWVGYDDNRPLGAKQTGGAVALPVFVDVVKAIGPKSKPFAKPPGLIEVRIDKATGLLAPEGAKEETTLMEVFVAGTEPTEQALLPDEVSAENVVTSEYDDEDDEEPEPAPPPEPPPDPTPEPAMPPEEQADDEPVSKP